MTEKHRKERNELIDEIIRSVWGMKVAVDALSKEAETMIHNGADNASEISGIAHLMSNTLTRLMSQIGELSDFTRPA